MTSLVTLTFLAGCNSEIKSVETSARKLCGTAIEIIDGTKLSHASGKAWVSENGAKIQYLTGPGYRCYVKNGRIIDFERNDVSIIDQIPEKLKAN